MYSYNKMKKQKTIPHCRNNLKNEYQNRNSVT